MASVTITYQYPDGSAARVRVHVDPSYPDACAEAKATAVSTWRETVGEFETEDES